MAEILDFKCTYDNTSENNPEVAKSLGLAFPEAYLRAETMAKLSKANKEKEESAVCIMSFCHTVEAEAMGANINLGNEFAGPRAKEYIYSNYEELQNLSKIDFSKGRIHEVLVACQMLREQGEQVVLEITGPITLLNMLIDTRHIFKGMRKNPEFMKQVFSKIGEELLRYVEEAKKYGVQMISFADSAGGVNILGPKMAEQMVNDFTYDFLKKLQQIAGQEMLILLCPKTTFALLGTEKAVFEDVPVSGKVTYGQGCVEVIGKAQIVGQQCIKNIKHVLNTETIKEVKLNNV